MLARRRLFVRPMLNPPLALDLRVRACGIRDGLYGEYALRSGGWKAPGGVSAAARSRKSRATINAAAIC